MRRWKAAALAVALVAVTLPFAKDSIPGWGFRLSKLAFGQPEGPRGTELRKVTPPPLYGVDLAKIDVRGDVATAPAHGDRVAELSVSPKYQRAANRLLRDGAVAEGAIVMTDVKTGKVLVWANYSEEAPLRDLARESFAPSASIFKIVTGSALVEHGLVPSTRECYRGGKSRVDDGELVRDEKRDKYCATLAEAMGRSLNVVFARHAMDHLDKDELESIATRLGWGREIPFDVPIEKSRLELPDEPNELARTAAGFWHTTLSPFQGANLATTLANGGEMIQLSIIDKVKDAEGDLYVGAGERHVLGRVIEERTARAVTTMMEATVDNGTSFQTFHDRSGRSYLPDVSVAGKTGTLEGKGYLFTWWVGFAPSDAPEIAVSVLVSNRGDWKVKATQVASDMLRVYFSDKGKKGVTDPIAAKNARN
ncbi:MAG: penicillin-binding protein [Polyangiaceae bacterium]|nr:penicillin-binding protein [Polyangiaceae bacterium]